MPDILPPSLEDLARRHVVVYLLGLKEYHEDIDEHRERVTPSSTASLWVLSSLGSMGDLGLLTEALLGQVVEEHPDKLIDTFLPLLISRTSKCLSLTSCLSLSSEMFIKISSDLPYLEEINLSSSGDQLIEGLFSVPTPTYFKQLRVVKLDSTNVTDSHIESLCLCSSESLRVLSVSTCPLLTDDVFSFVAPTGPASTCRGNLMDVNLDDCHLTTQAVRNLLQFSGTTIYSLNLTGIELDHTALFLLAGFTLDSNWSKQLNLEKSTLIKDETSGLLSLTVHHVTIVEEDPENSQNIEEVNPETHEPDISSSFTSNYIPPLRRLTLDTLPVNTATGVGWKALFMVCGSSLDQLSVLAGSGHPDLLSLIGKWSPQLTVFDMTENTTFEDSEGLRRLGDRLSSLVNFNAGFVPLESSVLNHYLQHRSITKLDLQATIIEDDACANISHYLGCQLISLDLSWCDQLTWEGVHSICTGCSNLRWLGLRCLAAHSESLLQLTVSNPLLEHLNLSRLKSPSEAEENAIPGQIVVTPDVMEGLSRLRNLRYLDISWNIEVEDAAVIHLLSSCHKLKTLLLAGLGWLTSRPFELLVDNWSRWRREQIQLKRRLLNLIDSRRTNNETNLSVLSLSEEIVEPVYKPYRSLVYATNLRLLGLEYCDGQNDCTLDDLVRICQGTLHILDFYGKPIVPD